MTEKQPEIARMTGDVVAFSRNADGEVCALVIERGWEPYEGCLALPGGHVDQGEDTETAARRELAEETGLSIGSLELVGVYAAPNRDPRGRYVTWAYTGWRHGMPQPTAGDDADAARWVTVDELLAGRLAFDHHQIIHDALRVAL